MTEDYRDSPMSVGDWMITLLVLAIPLVNIILLLYWALSSSGNINRKNFCIAYLLWALIIIGLFIVIAVLGAGIGMLAAG